MLPLLQTQEAATVSGQHLHRSDDAVLAHRAKAAARLWADSRDFEPLRGGVWGGRLIVADRLSRRLVS